MDTINAQSIIFSLSTLVQMIVIYFSLCKQFSNHINISLEKNNDKNFKLENDFVL